MSEAADPLAIAARLRRRGDCQLDRDAAAAIERLCKERDDWRKMGDALLCCGVAGVIIKTSA